MKYRIKIETTKGGDVKYIPQQKKLFFWSSYRYYDWYGIRYTQTFNDPEAAKQFIKRQEHMNESDRLAKIDHARYVKYP